MKKPICLTFLLTICLNCSGQKIINNIADKIIVKQVSFDILTIVNISCDRFDDYFSNKIKSNEINEPSKILELTNILNTLEKTESNKNLDIRAKIYLNFSNNSTLVCVDQFYTEINGIQYETSMALLKAIERLNVCKNKSKKNRIY